MKDGKRANTTKLTRKWHEYNKINLHLSLPDISHNRNPIKNGWGLIKTVLSRENPSTIDDNKKVVKKLVFPDPRLPPEALCLYLKANGGSHQRRGRGAQILTSENEIHPKFVCHHHSDFNLPPSWNSCDFYAPSGIIPKDHKDHFQGWLGDGSEKRNRGFNWS